MAGARSTNTMSEGLQRLLSDVAQMATAPDADLQFLTQLQMMITQYLRSFAPQGTPQAGGPGMPPPGNSGGAMQGLSVGAPQIQEVARMLGGGMPGA